MRGRVRLRKTEGNAARRRAEAPTERERPFRSRKIGLAGRGLRAARGGSVPLRRRGADRERRFSRERPASPQGAIERERRAGDETTAPTAILRRRGRLRAGWEAKRQPG